jgi:hypothetical protein
VDRVYVVPEKAIAFICYILHAIVVPLLSPLASHFDCNYTSGGHPLNLARRPWKAKQLMGKK